MRLRKEAGLGVGAILALQVPLTMLAITLLTRMGPAIERILEENVYSAEAVEEMIAVLAAPESGASTVEIADAFDRALDRALTNITEADEAPLLETIRQRRGAAFAGDADARAEVIGALRALGEVNRRSMVRADRQAQRLGQAGAWGAAMLGAISLALGILVYRRIRLRLELPIVALRRTTARIRAGNTQARYSTADGPLELTATAADLNWLLDRWLQTSRRTGAEQTERDVEIRRVLAWLLDRQPVPTVVVDAGGHRVAASAGALDLAIPGVRAWVDDGSDGSADGARPTDDDAPAPSPSTEWQVDEVEGTSLRVLRRVEAA